MKNNLRLGIVLLIMFSLIGHANAFTTNSSGKIFEITISRGKNTDTSSSNYKSYSVMGDITSAVESLNYKAGVGILPTLPYLNGEPCQSGIECLGGVCCASPPPSCPTISTVGGGSGGAGLVVKIPVR